MTWKPASRRSDHQYRTQFIHDQAIFEKDGMTWDEIISLARKHTRSDGGVNYRGMVLGDFGVMKSMLQLPFFGKDGKAQLTTPAWLKVAQTGTQH